MELITSITLLVPEYARSIQLHVFSKTRQAQRESREKFYCEFASRPRRRGGVKFLERSIYIYKMPRD